MSSRRRWTCPFAAAILGVAIAGLLVPSASSAGAQASETTRYKGWETASVDLQGLEGDLAAELVKGLALSGRFKLYRRVRPRFYPNLLEEDLERARLFLARHGYPYARVVPHIDPDVRKERVAILLRIRPGPAVQVTSIEAQGLPSHWLASRELKLPLRPGMVFSEPLLSQARADLETDLRDDGYALATVQTTVSRVDSSKAAVCLEVHPGSRYRISSVAVGGTRPDLALLARRAMMVRTGQRYSLELIRDAETNLRMLDMFRQIRISTAEAGEESLEVRAKLIERMPRSLEAGIGYWSDEFLRAQLRWEHRNLLRGGRGVGLAMTYSRFTQTAGISTWWPTLFGARSRASLRIGVEHQQEKSFDLWSKDLELSAGYWLSLRSKLRAGVTLSQVDVEAVTLEPGAFIESGGMLTVLSLRWHLDRTNDRLYPTSGLTNSISAEWAPAGLLSESHFVRGEVFAAGYQTMFGGLTTAVRLNLGVARPIGGSADLLPNRRFFAGGSRSMRGFKRRRLGPLDAEGAPLGGEALVGATLELRFPLVWRFKGAIFADAGQVWRRYDLIAARDVEYAAGPGIMLQTPVGPLRADWAHRLTFRVEGQPEAVLHISVGQPF